METSTTTENTPKKENILEIKNLSVWIAKNHIVKNISITIPKNKVIAIMGPSGCGKSSLLRAINRMHDLNGTTRVEGKILLDEKIDILTAEATQVRKKIGMVFQKPNPFPNMSVYENVISGYTLIGKKLEKAKKDQLVEENLIKAALWEEVKDRLHTRATTLSGGQQQRLCIARSLAMVVDVLLLDEPTSALDPVATAKIENLIETLKKEVTIMIVTHNNAQASRISDYTGFMYMGEMVEYNQTKVMFTVPKEKKTEEYLSGKFS